MLGYLEYLAVKLLGIIVRVLPQKLIIFIGRLIGSLFYLFDRKHRQISLVNLKKAFGEEKTTLELKRIARYSFINLCQGFFEVLLFPKFKEKSLVRFVAIEGRNYLDMVRSQGRGGILLTAHFGNWELSAVWAVLKGYPLCVIAREQKQTRLNLLLNQYRSSSGLKVYTKGMVVRDLITALQQNEFVGILGDQDAGRRGLFIDFFNRPASTHPGPILLALRTGAPILPCFIVRSGFKHKIYVNPPIYLGAKREDQGRNELMKSRGVSQTLHEPSIDIKNSPRAQLIKRGLEDFTRILESYIRHYPEQWLWLHRRWKTQPKEDFTEKKINIVILSDGKPGHFRQSRGIAQGFPKAKVFEVRIDYQNKFWKFFLALLAPLLWNSAIIKFFLKKSLPQNIFQGLSALHPQVIISAGSSLAALNLLYGQITQAKKIVCMKPGIIRVKHFDLVIAPQHDHLPIKKNVLNTFASPHPLRKEDLEPQAKSLKDKYNLKGDRFLGLLLGGESPYFFISRETIKKIIEELKKISEIHKFRLLLTSSRRTPIQIEEEIKNIWPNFSNLELFISPREESDNPVGGILGLSEVVVVTEDSISMIAEAASSGKKIVVLQIDRKFHRKRPKHLETIQNLVQKGYLYLAKPDELSQIVNQILVEDFTHKILADTEKAIERVKELLVNC